jgi:hypothetical protein
MKAQGNINPDKLKSVSEYAKLIGKTTQRVYQLIDAGDIKTMLLGKKIFVIVN